MHHKPGAHNHFSLYGGVASSFVGTWQHSLDSTQTGVLGGDWRSGEVGGAVTTNDMVVMSMDC